VFKALHQSKPAVIQAAIALLLVAGCIALIPGADNPMQRWLYDLSQRHYSASGATSEVVIVAIDEDSKAKLGSWPWSNSLHASAIEKLRTSGARVIGFTVPLQASDPAGGSQLEQAMKAHGRVVLPLEVSLRPNGDDSDRRITSLLNRTQRHFGDGTLDSALTATLCGIRTTSC
jgi:CHASE2 domain-containing sensor protein